ncbi:MAG: hypothetical protein MUP11_13080 [Anaerolineales bacterium]|nr:hypothetical protein [Anaerolineales bacterium]
MKTHFPSLFLLILTSILWGCTPEIGNPIPTIDQTATQPGIMVTSPKPSNTATWTNVPDTVTPSPSPTLPVTTSTETTQYPPTPHQSCHPGELDTYLDVYDPIIRQLIIMAREVGQLEELPKTRAEEILAETNKLELTINSFSVPTCLEYAQQRTVNAIILLKSSINLLFDEDFDKAKNDLEGSFEDFTRAIIYIGLLSAEETETSTPDQ